MIPLILTDEQKRAAAANVDRAYIEAAPGSGKTTVAAERYGTIRYSPGANGSGIVGLSFARSARHELQHRVQRRWGGAALQWPHKVWTLDSLHCALLSHLLHSESITWPGGHTKLTVIDTWRGHPGSRQLQVGNAYRRKAIVKDRKVVTVGERVTRNFYGYGNKAPHETMLKSGVCTHDEVRSVLAAALSDPQTQAVIEDYFSSTTRGIIVDEVFDGDGLDLIIVALAANAGVPTTIIGDPWQALYDFRGARPELVPQLIEKLGFTTFPVSESFRFETNEMRALTDRLRLGQGVTVEPGSTHEADVVLATHWGPLWSAADNVLPLSFGQMGNRIDAAIGLLLERVVDTHFGELITIGPEAALILGLDPDLLRSNASAIFGPVLERLHGGHPHDAAAALKLLRTLLVDIGSKQIPKLHADNEAERVERMTWLGQRLAQTKGKIVPAMTVHQAKGREWPYVGVHLTDSQSSRLAEGLSQESEADRKLYVAMTRAKRETWAI